LEGLVYKILSPVTWTAAADAPFAPPAPVDVQDGYMHLSAAGQVAETLRLHFAGQDEIVLLEVDAVALGPDLRWEPSRGGALFPHLYGDLPKSAVRKVWTITRNPRGTFDLPAVLA